MHEVQTTDLDAGTKLLKIVNQALDTQVTKTDSPQVDRHVLANELAKVTGSPYDKLQQVNLSKPVARRISKKAQKLWREKLPSLNRA
ncbi:MAG: hypothetical protein EB059_06680 [Alphaproteobacteria bacterium]|nr:hypothetical protein [Alphaproteobacteria bacterium]